MRFVLCSLLALAMGHTTSAQNIQVIAGPMLGLSSPGLGRWMDRTDRQSKPSTSSTSGRLGPVAGIDAGLTFWNHLAIDAAVQWSSVGYVYTEVGFVNPTTEVQIGETMRFQKISLPFTIGYAARIGSVPVRVGVGYALIYFTSGRYEQEIIQSIRPHGSYSFARQVDVFSEEDNFILGPSQVEKGEGRYQGCYRIALSLQPEPRLRLCLAAMDGREMSVYSTHPSATGPENRIRFASNTFDLTATLLIFR